MIRGSAAALENVSLDGMAKPNIKSILYFLGPLRQSHDQL